MEDDVLASRVNQIPDCGRRNHSTLCKQQNRIALPCFRQAIAAPGKHFNDGKLDDAISEEEGLILLRKKEAETNAAAEIINLRNSPSRETNQVETVDEESDDDEEKVPEAVERTKTVTFGNATERPSRQPLPARNWMSPTNLQQSVQKGLQNLASAIVGKSPLAPTLPPPMTAHPSSSSTTILPTQGPPPPRAPPAVKVNRTGTTNQGLAGKKAPPPGSQATPKVSLRATMHSASPNVLSRPKTQQAVPPTMNTPQGAGSGPKQMTLDQPPKGTFGKRWCGLEDSKTGDRQYVAEDRMDLAAWSMAGWLLKEVFEDERKASGWTLQPFLPPTRDSENASEGDEDDMPELLNHRMPSGDDSESDDSSTSSSSDSSDSSRRHRSKGRKGKSKSRSRNGAKGRSSRRSKSPNHKAREAQELQEFYRPDLAQEDPSKGEARLIFNYNIDNQEEFDKQMAPPGMHVDDRKALYNCVPDVVSLPGKRYDGEMGTQFMTEIPGVVHATLGALMGAGENDRTPNDGRRGTNTPWARSKVTTR